MKKSSVFIFICSFFLLTITICIFQVFYYSLNKANNKKEEIYEKNNISQKEENINSPNISYINNSIYLSSGDCIGYDGYDVSSLIVYNVSTQNYIVINNSEYSVLQSGYYIVYGIQKDKIINISNSLTVDSPVDYIIE